MYCGATNSHDQYFFRHRQEMVAGNVREPRLDLTNPALIRAHLQAEWLAETGVNLGQSMESIIDLDHRESDGSQPLSLRADITHHLNLSRPKLVQLRQRLKRMFVWDQASLEQCRWFSETWLDQLLQEARDKFDRAFNRWRELYATVATQLDVTQQKLNLSRKREEQDQLYRE